jgi:hypothetical protein
MDSPRVIIRPGAIMGRMLEPRVKIAAVVCAALLLASSADGQTTRRRERERPAPAAKVEAVDKRDSLAVVPGNPLNNRPYWLALGQCGGTYFRLTELSTEAAIRARVVKPDKTVDATFTRQADEARKVATAFFVAAERFLITDRGIERDEAIPIYDAKASEAGNRLKTIDAALDAIKPCPALYQACQRAFAKICSDTPALTN